MAKDLLGGSKAYWEDEDVLEGTDLFASIPEQAPLLDRLGLGIKQAFAGVGNTADTAGTLAWQGLGTLMTGGKPLSEENFKKLNQRIKEREEWAGKGDPGFAGKLAGVAATLPMQVLNMPVSGVETAKQFIDQGESLGRAYAAGGIDTAGNVAGLMLPGVMQGGKLLRAASGAGINAAQDTLTRAAISGIAETEGARDLFAPSWETAGLAAIPGAALGVLTGKKGQKKTPTPKKDIGAIIASETTGDVPAGMRAGEFAGEVDMALWNKNKEQQAAQQQQAYADALEAQRVSEAEVYAAQQYPEQSTTGLSTGEGSVGGKVINRSPVTDSGLMGLPQRPVEPPVGLSTGEGLSSVRDPSRPQGASNLMGLPEAPVAPPVGLSLGESTPGGAVINRAAGPSNLMGEPVPGPVGLSTGEGKSGGANVTRQPTTDSGLMGQAAPPPFDPFGSAGATPRRIGRFGQGGAIHPQLAEDVYKLGKSVMRGANGLLKVFYHGAVQPIEGTFKKSVFGDLGQAVYVTDDPKAAGKFAQGIRGSNTEPQFGGNTHPVYLNIENNFDNKAFVGNEGWQQYIKSLIAPIAKRAFEYERQPWFKTSVDTLLENLDKGQAKVEDLFTMKATDHQKEKYTSVAPWATTLSQTLKDAGWNGIELNDGRYHQVAVFDPENVKDALNPTNGVNRFGQGGQAPIIGDLAQGIVRLGGGLKGMFTGVRSETPDTLTTPRSTENIAAKTALRNKANAIGKTDSVYQNVTTVEEALANLPSKDIGSNQTLASGNEGVIRRNTTNGPLKFVRYLRTKAQTNTDALTAKYITGKDGFNETFRKLSDAEKMEVHETIQELSKQRVDYTDALADKLGFTPEQKAFMEARGRALKAVLETANTTNKALGFDMIKALPGYSPGMFASTYVSLVGHYKGEGTAKRWVTEAVVNANSKWEYQQGLEHYKKQGKETITLDRRGLNTSTKGGRNFDGTMKLLAALAEHDSRFADAKGILDSFLKDQTKKLYNFDVHEMRKKGVEGNIGNKPWLDAKQNAKEALEAEVNYMDEAFKYWNYQEMLNKTKQLVDDPKLEAYPNTRKYLDKYVKQVTGNNLHPMGAGVNAFVDFIFEKAGSAAAKSNIPYLRNIPENPNRVFAGAREFGSALMMNIYAPAFATIQLVQMFQSGIPEAMKIRNEMGLSPMDPVISFGRAMTTRAWLAGLDKLGKLEESKAPQYIKDAWEYAKKNGMNSENTPTQMKDAYKWMREHGIDHYNEIQMSHEAAQNPKWTKAKNLAFWPTRLPEMMTRPTVFMWYADMFHQAGLRGEELHYTAKNATDYAMVNYHTDERPMVYQQLGVVGQSVGALRTFVHNAAEQQITRTKEAKQNPGAFLAMLGFTGALMGVAGMPFYDEIDQWFIQPVTKRSARDWMGEALHPALINGAASQYTGIDLQSRFSMADMVPGNPIEALAGPQLSRMFQILDSGFGYIKNQDTKSFNELAKAAIPSGAYGAYEEANLVQDGVNELGEPIGYVLDKEGQVKYSQGRSEKERNVRKVLGLRPLRERLEDEDLYTTKKLEQRMTDKQKDAFSRMKAGLNLNDSDGFDNARQDYLDNEGDPRAIKQLVKRNAVQSQLSARQRQIVAPGKSVGSVNKYNRYWED